ncbi:hypothetical protein [Roseospirillum parvum]|uniref:Uncharacterized protein n=1 Tax=Roseospirillum parvum TaxID=83401 RepID=A0A1G7VZT0_9PROT|nr:hypothetical protein [Roseospirillum parvum]SDG65286.1 hypothetical protein SAMN05421742_10229 [Roseospirillum parvum]
MSAHTATADTPLGDAHPSEMAGPPPDSLLAQLPGEVLDILTGEQKARLTRIRIDGGWRRHPVDLRLSLPLPGRRFYLTVIAGEEKRDAHRRQAERHRYPLPTVGNLFFLLGLAGLFYATAMVGMLFYSGVLD